MQCRHPHTTKCTPKNIAFTRALNDQQPAWTQPKPSKSYQRLHLLFSKTLFLVIAVKDAIPHSQPQTVSKANASVLLPTPVQLKQQMLAYTFTQVWTEQPLNILTGSGPSGETSASVSAFMCGSTACVCFRATIYNSGVAVLNLKNGKGRALKPRKEIEGKTYRSIHVGGG